MYNSFFFILTFFPATNVQNGKVHAVKTGNCLCFPKVSIYCYSTIGGSDPM